MKDKGRICSFSGIKIQYGDEYAYEGEYLRNDWVRYRESFEYL